MKVICYGDSNTYGYDPRSWFGDRYDQNWPKLLAEKTGWDISNRGENGREVPRMSVSFPEDITLLIVMLGTNDLLQNRSVDLIRNRMESFLVSQNLTSGKILLLAPPPMALGAWVENSELLRERHRLAMELCDLAEGLGTLFADPGDWNIPLAYDGVHLTQEGHQVFADRLFDYLKEKRLCWKSE